jgi:hypothetical protein
MKLLDNKIVKVGNISFPVRITMRAMIEYESMTGSSIASFDGTEKLIKFFYCTAKAGAKANNIEFKYTYEDFLDIIDPYYTEVITNFSKALAESGGDGKKQMTNK